MRISYLTKAIGNAKSCTYGMGHKVNELEGKLEIAKVQKKVLSEFKRTFVGSPEEQKQVIDELNTRLLSVNEVCTFLINYHSLAVQSYCPKIQIV